MKMRSCLPLRNLLEESASKPQQKTPLQKKSERATPIDKQRRDAIVANLQIASPFTEIDKSYEHLKTTILQDGARDISHLSNKYACKPRLIHQWLYQNNSSANHFDAEDKAVVVDYFKVLLTQAKQQQTKNDRVAIAKRLSKVIPVSAKTILQWDKNAKQSSK